MKNPNITDDKIEEASDEMQLNEIIQDISRYYTNEFDKRSINLSGGQKQRLAILEILTFDAPFIILDNRSVLWIYGRRRCLKRNSGFTFLKWNRTKLKIMKNQPLFRNEIHKDRKGVRTLSYDMEKFVKSVKILTVIVWTSLFTLIIRVFTFHKLFIDRIDRIVGDGIKIDLAGDSSSALPLREQEKQYGFIINRIAGERIDRKNDT